MNQISSPNQKSNFDYFFNNISKFILAFIFIVFSIHSLLLFVVGFNLIMFIINEPALSSSIKFLMLPITFGTILFSAFYFFLTKLFIKLMKKKDPMNYLLEQQAAFFSKFFR